MIYRPRHFKAFELVDRATFEKHGEASLAFLRRDALELLDAVADLLAVPVVVNDWHGGGHFQWSGLRTLDYTQGAARSAHRLGAAFDIKCKGLAPVDIFNRLIHAQAVGALPALRRMEAPSATPTWNHLDTLDHDAAGVLVVWP